METNQFAVYQLKQIPENREIQFRSYKSVQERKIHVCYENYEQRYIGRMLPGDTPESIRSRLKKQTPRTFTGHSISVSDVIVLNEAGVVTSYYVDKDEFIVIQGFIRKISSSALISLDTTDFCIEGKKGTWLAYDNIIINGKEFFLMEHTTYGNDAPNVVLDEAGKIVMDQVCHGFDETVQRRIKEYLNSEIPVEKTGKQKKIAPESWQKYYENGEYLRSAEITEEQNYNMIDGCMNNLPAKPRKIGNRISVLDRLHLKQTQLDKRRAKPELQEEAAEDMQRRRK